MFGLFAREQFVYFVYSAVIFFAAFSVVFMLLLICCNIKSQELFDGADKRTSHQIQKSIENLIKDEKTKQQSGFRFNYVK